MQHFKKYSAIGFIASVFAYLYLSVLYEYGILLTTHGIDFLFAVLTILFLPGMMLYVHHRNRLVKIVMYLLAGLITLEWVLAIPFLYIMLKNM